MRLGHEIEDFGYKNGTSIKMRPYGLKIRRLGMKMSLGYEKKTGLVYETFWYKNEIFGYANETFDYDDAIFDYENVDSAERTPHPTDNASPDNQVRASASNETSNENSAVVDSNFSSQIPSVHEKITFLCVNFVTTVLLRMAH